MSHFLCIKVVEIDHEELCLNARTLHPDQPRVLSFSRDEGGTFSPGQLAWSLEEPGYYPRTNDTLVNDAKPWVPFWQTTQLLEDNDTRPARAAGCQVCLHDSQLDYIVTALVLTWK